MPDPHVKLNYGLYCDDVRVETNGKQIYIGVFGDDILINQKPFSLNLFVVINLLTMKAGKFGLEFQSFLEDKLVSASKGHLEVDGDSEGRHVAINVPLPLLNIQEEAELKTKFREEGGEWHTAVSANIIFNSVES